MLNVRLGAARHAMAADKQGNGVSYMGLCGPGAPTKLFGGDLKRTMPTSLADLYLPKKPQSRSAR